MNTLHIPPACSVPPGNVCYPTCRHVSRIASWGMYAVGGCPPGSGRVGRLSYSL
ncbi:MAG TPA: hypothetical protein VJ933_05505 [Phaeodactylibacter sp.]|nr:hypothetical protein [Phaeodactylibacter sp.]